MLTTMAFTESKQVRLSYLVTTGQYCPAAILSYMIESKSGLTIFILHFIGVSSLVSPSYLYQVCPNIITSVSLIARAL